MSTLAVLPETIYLIPARHRTAPADLYSLGKAATSLKTLFLDTLLFMDCMKYAIGFAREAHVSFWVSLGGTCLLLEPEWTQLSKRIQNTL